ncbi:hypothetical protein N824_12555 [Pedobacter sp. V48]|nr:hypothetical protein N824_12555 [Pedobacter sp. V48]
MNNYNPYNCGVAFKISLKQERQKISLEISD